MLATTTMASTRIMIFPMGKKGHLRCSSQLTISVPPVVEPRRNTTATPTPMAMPPNSAERMVSPV